MNVENGILIGEKLRAAWVSDVTAGYLHVVQKRMSHLIIEGNERRLLAGSAESDQNI